ncbi:MAG: DUF1385 domain-containing protein [Eubacterium sp.]
MGLVMLLAIVLAVGIFVIVPFLISEALKRPVPSPQLRGLIEGVIRVSSFCCLCETDFLYGRY